MTATDAEPVPPSARYPRRAILVALFVALTGPLVGALTLLILVFGRIVAGLNYEDGVMPSVADLAQVVLVVSMFAYLLAGWSAVLAGAMLGWRTYTHGTFGYLFAMGAAIVATVVGTASLDLMVGQPDQSFIGMALFFTPFSVVAALAGRWLMARIGILPTSEMTSLARR